MIVTDLFESVPEQGMAEAHGNYAGDRPVNLGGVSMKMIQAGDTVRYIGQKAEVLDMSKDRKHARISIERGMGGITQNVLTSDLQQFGQGMREATDEGVAEGDVGAAIGKAVGTVAGAEFGPAGSMVGGAIGSSIGNKITGESKEGNELGVAEGWRDMFRSKPVAPTQAAAPAGGTGTLSPRFSANIRNPATNKPYTNAELRALAAQDTVSAKKRTGGKKSGEVSMTPDAIRKRNARKKAATTADTAPNPFGQMANQLQNYGTSTGGRVTGTATGLKHTANPNNPNAVPAAAATPAAEPVATATPAVTPAVATPTATPVASPNFAPQNLGYKSVNYAPNIKIGASMPKPLGAPIAAAPSATKVTSGGPTPDEKAKLAQRIAQAVKEPVAEMLQMVETKEDVQRIKKFIDDTFVKHGAVNESAFVVRNKILEHVTQVGAQRRRDFAAQQAQ